MFRSAVLAMALALAIGPTGSLLCGAWCDRAAERPRAAHGCHAEQAAPASPALEADLPCNGHSAGVVAIFSDDGRRVVRPALHMVSASGHQSSPALAWANGRRDGRGGRAMGARPPSIPLRI